MEEAEPGLVERARAGDRAAFREIVEAHKERLYAVALGMMRDHHDAEDAVQESFLRAYRSLATFRAGAQVGSWLYRITVNVCLDAARRRRRLGAPVALGEREDLQPPEPHPVADPERRAVSRDLRQAIDRAVLDLAPLERAVFVLRHHQELPLKEIAAVLGRPEGTVKSVLFRGLRKLQRRLAPLRAAS